MTDEPHEADHESQASRQRDRQGRWRAQSVEMTFEINVVDDEVLAQQQAAAIRNAWNGSPTTETVATINLPNRNSPARP